MKIAISHVSKSFGKAEVLHDITLDANPGEILCLLGPSGSGKTTLIRLLIGAMPADSGIITIDGRRVPNRESIRSIGYMPQNDAVYNDISGYDNLMFFGRLHGLREKRLRQRVDETLALVDLTRDKGKLVANYSGGMKKRLSLAIAFLHDPPVLILDEPTVGIDPLLRKTIWDEFDRFCAAGKTIIISTHVMDEAAKCQRAALLHDGSLIANDTIGRLRARSATGSLEDLFFHHPEGGEPQ